MSFWTVGVDLFFVLSGFIMMWTFGHRFGEPGAWRNSCDVVIRIDTILDLPQR
jgi:peptidoglycan/LPS O-acetylase OafA/YrhL